MFSQLINERTEFESSWANSQFLLFLLAEPCLHPDDACNLQGEARFILTKREYSGIELKKITKWDSIESNKRSGEEPSWMIMDKK